MSGAGFFNQIAQISDHLYLSSASAIKEKRLRDLGITNVINLTLDVPVLRAKGIETLQVHIEDVPHSNLSVYFDKCADKVKQVAKKGGKTLVHCVAGVSRSATICIVYLMKYHGMKLRNAFFHVRSKRQFVRPNVGFWKQMIAFERKLHGSTTVKMVNSSIGWIPDVYHEETKNMVWETTYSATHNAKALKL